MTVRIATKAGLYASGIVGGIYSATHNGSRFLAYSRKCEYPPIVTAITVPPVVALSGIAGAAGGAMILVTSVAWVPLYFWLKMHPLLGDSEKQ